MKRIGFKSVFVVMAMLLLASVAHADLHYTMKSTTGPYKIMGKDFPAQETTINGWIGDSLAYMDMDTAAVLLNTKTGTVFMIDKQKKTYAELNLNNISAMVNSATEGMDEKQAQAMQDMMKKMMGSAKFDVTATGEAKKIGDYDCNEYKMTFEMMGMNNLSDIWTTKDIDVDPQKYFQMAFAMMAVMPGMEKAIDETKKMEGFPVFTKSTSSVMGTNIESTTELTGVEEAKAPAGTYSIPEGYTKTEMGPKHK